MAFASGAAFGHAHLQTPTPRNTLANKAGPCGVAKGPVVATFAEGASIPVSFIETIDHTGCFVLELSSTGEDTDFVPLKTLADNLTPQSYDATLKLSAGVTCANCTLRLRQIMGADPATCGPSTVGTDGTYFSCADIAIVGDGGAALDAGTDASVPAPDASTESDSGQRPGDASSPSGTRNAPDDAAGGCGVHGGAPPIELAGGLGLSLAAGLFFVRRARRRRDARLRI